MPIKNKTSQWNSGQRLTTLVNFNSNPEYLNEISGPYQRTWVQFSYL